MSTRESVLRYIHITNKLRKAPATFEEIDHYLLGQSELTGYKLNISKRHFPRVLEDIETIFDIEISYDFKRRVYSINELEQSEWSQRRMEAFDTFHALKIGENTAKSIHFERRRPQGTENLFGLLHAIKNNLQISFIYQKFWDEKSTLRIADPLALKEFKNRWYVLIKDHKDQAVKTFGLDRMSELETSSIKFKVPVDFDVEKIFKYYFCILNPEDLEPQDIVLSFDQVQGKYIKTLPLHHTQQIILDNENELQVKLKICVTYDFIMELLSFGNRMKVLQPHSLEDKIKREHQKAFKQYN